MSIYDDQIVNFEYLILFLIGFAAVYCFLNRAVCTYWQVFNCFRFFARVIRFTVKIKDVLTYSGGQRKYRTIQFSLKVIDTEVTIFFSRDVCLNVLSGKTVEILQ